SPCPRFVACRSRPSGRPLGRCPDCQRLGHARQYRSPHPQTLRLRWRATGLGTQVPADPASTTQDRWPRRSAPDRHLLWATTQGTHTLDVAVAGRRTLPAPTGDADQWRGRTLGAQKNELQPWRKQCWCVPERDAARFVAQMEDVLDLYVAPH